MGNHSRTTIYLRSGWRKYLHPLYWYTGLMYYIFLATPYPDCSVRVRRFVERHILGHAGHYGNWDAYDYCRDHAE